MRGESNSVASAPSEPVSAASTFAAFVPTRRQGRPRSCGINSETSQGRGLGEAVFRRSRHPRCRLRPAGRAASVARPTAAGVCREALFI